MKLLAIATFLLPVLLSGQPTQINYYSQVKNLPAIPVDIEQKFGAVCDWNGTTGTNNAASVAAAIAAGFTSILTPAHCMWIAPGGVMSSTLANPITYFGQNPVTSVVMSANPPSSLAITAQPGATIVGMNVMGNSCTGVTDCATPFYVNARAVNDNPVMTGWSAMNIALGQDMQIAGGISGSNIRNYGEGDGWFAAQYGNAGVAIRADLEKGSGTALVVDVNCAGPSGAGACSGGAGITITNSDTGGAIPDLTFFDTGKTSGNIAVVNQRGTTMTGDVFVASMADVSGSFTGHYLNFANGGTTKFQVTSTGQIVAPLYKSSSGLNYACFDSSGNLVSQASPC